MESTLKVKIDGGQAKSEAGVLKSFLQGLKEGGEQAAKGVEKVGVQAKKTSSEMDGLKGTAGLLKGALVAVAGSALFNSFKETAIETEKLMGSLKTMTGSMDNAGQAFGKLTKFAETTPYTLEQSVQGFIKLTALGLEPSERALQSYGNTATAMGKDMTDMVEAVAGATTGEYERLKGFGIKAKSEGDRISLTFQGVTTTIGKSSEEIQDYLIGIGETKFAGAMEDQMKSLPGLMSNLEDNISGLWRSFGDAGATDLFKSALIGASDAITWITEHMVDLKSAVIGGMGLILQSTENVKFAWEAWGISTEMAFARMAYSVVETYTDMLTTIAGIMSKIPGTDDMVAGIRGYAAEVKAGAPDIAAYDKALGDLITTHETESKAITGNIADMQQYAYEQDSAKKKAALHGKSLEDLAGYHKKAGDAVKAQTKEEKAHTDEVAKLIKGLENEKAALHLTGLEKEIQTKLSSLKTKAGKEEEEQIRALITANYNEERALKGPVAELKNELAMLQLGEREKRIAIALRQQNTTAASEEGRQIADLTGKIYDQEQSLDAQKAALQASEQAADPWADAMTGAVERIDTAFADLWKSAFRGFKEFGAALKDSFYQLLAELAHAAITRPIVMSLTTAIAGGSSTLATAAGTPGAAGTSGVTSGISSLVTGLKGFGTSMSGLYGSAAEGLRTIGMETAANMADAQAGIYGASGTAGSLAYGAANLGAGYLGKLAGDKVWGETSGVGSTIGGIAGSIVGGPIGTAIGSFIGAGLEKGLGNLFGYGGNNNDGKNTASASFDMTTDTYGKGTGSGKSWKKGEGIEQAQGVDKLLLTLKTLSDTIGGSSYKGTVTLDSRGSASLSGKTFTDANQLIAFGFKNIVAAADQLDPRLKTIVAAFNGTAEEIGVMVTAMQSLTEMVKTNPVGTAIDDYATAAERASYTLMDVYSEQEASIATLMSTFDGTLESTVALNDAVALNRQNAYQLTMVLLQTKDAMQGLTESSAQYYREAALTEAELTTQRKARAAAIKEEILTTFDPVKLQQLSTEYTQIQRGIFDALKGTLDPAQLKTVSEQFATDAEGFGKLVAGQLQSAIDSISTSQAGQNTALDAILTNHAQAVASNNKTAKEFTDKQAASVDRFIAAVEEFARNTSVKISLDLPEGVSGGTELAT